MASASSPIDMSKLKLNERFMLYQTEQVSLNADHLVPCSQIRPIKEEGVEKLMGNIRLNGWTPSSVVFVKAPPPTTPDDQKRFGVIDGMHRVTALQRLNRENPEGWTTRQVTATIL